MSASTRELGSRSSSWPWGLERGILGFCTSEAYLKILGTSTLTIGDGLSVLLARFAGGLALVLLLAVAAAGDALVL
jgi:hypothetical protein